MCLSMICYFSYVTWHCILNNFYFVIFLFNYLYFIFMHYIFFYIFVRSVDRDFETVRTFVFYRFWNLILSHMLTLYPFVYLHLLSPILTLKYLSWNAHFKNQSKINHDKISVTWMTKKKHLSMHFWLWPCL